MEEITVDLTWDLLMAIVHLLNQEAAIAVYEIGEEYNYAY